MRSLVFVAALLLSATTAHAGQTLCFRLQDLNQPSLGYIDYKLSIQPNCTAVASSQAGNAPTISAVHGTSQGFDLQGNPTEGFLLAGTCEGNVGVVFLVAQNLGGGDRLSIVGPSLAGGTAQLGSLTGPVLPVRCQDLDP